MRTQKKYKCPVCNNKIYQNFGSWASHIELMHRDIIPENWTPARYLYFLQTGMKEGHCVECKGPTDWNEITKKYERYCKNPRCKQIYINRAKSRMIGIYGKEHILNDPEVQRKMQAAKKTAGVVVFDDGGSVNYLCSYEKDFLEMLNGFGFPSNDIIGPSPNTYVYQYTNPNDKEHEGEHFYIPDYYIPSLNLEIEIKTQQNMHPKIQVIDKVKEMQKDAMMKTQKNIHYIKLSDKNYFEFYLYLIKLGEITMANNKEPSKIALEEVIYDRNMISLDNDIFSIAMEDHNRCEYLEDGREPVLQLLPGEKPYGLLTLRNAISEDLFLISDFHVTYADEMNKLRAANIIKNVNDTVPENAHLLILGDLGGKRGQESADDVKDFISKIKCKNKYLILGNHDKLSIHDYVKMGFKAVTDYFNWKNVTFSHIPIAVKSGCLNIHGHNHGTETYINDGVSADDHIDVYDSNFIPKTLRQIMNIDGSPIRESDEYGEPVHISIDWNEPDRVPQDKIAEEAMSELYPHFFELEYLYQENLAMESKSNPSTITMRKRIYRKAYYPIYIVLQHGGNTPLSKAIKVVTGDEYTHACIAFDDSLNHMWSFGQKDRVDILKGLESRVGFLAEQGLHSDYYRFNKVKYAIYYLEVDKETYSEMMERLRFFQERRYQMKYDWIALATNFFNIPKNENMRWICSSFVAYLLGAAMPLEKHYSTYTPQDIATITEHMILLMEGNDIYREYRPEKCKKIIGQMKAVGKMPKILTGKHIESSPVTEGLLDIFNKQENITESFWRNKIFEGNSFTGKTKRNMPNYSRYISLKKVLIDKVKGIISIQHVNIRLLLNRIKETYGERRLDYIFEIMYKRKDVELFKKKKLNRSQMKMEALESPLFFAMELNVLFMELYEQYKDASYKIIANSIYENTWLKECDEKKVPSVDMTALSELNNQYQLKPHQEEFIRKYKTLKTRINLNGYFLAFDQGLGKTLTATALSLCLHADHVYIVCPNSLKEVWATELRKYVKKYSDNSKLADKEIVICKKGGRAGASGRYFIINLESIPLMYPYILKGNNMIIIDEMHNFRNLDGKRSSELFELRDRVKSSDILLMSGTPIKAAPSELSPALKMIDPLFTDEAARVYDRCFNLNETAAMTVVRKRFGYIMYRKTKEILDLPIKMIDDLALTIENPERFYMKNIKSEVESLFNDYYSYELQKNESYRNEFVNLVSHYTSSNKTELDKYINWIIKTVNTNRSMNMHEIDQLFIESYLNTYVKPNMTRNSDYERVKELERIFIRMERSCYSRAIGKIYPPRRTELFTKLYLENEDIFLDMISSNTKKTVIFSQFLDVINSISDALTKAGIDNVKIIGETANRMDLIEQFKNDDNIEVILATSQTLGTGVTLVEANQMFFFGPPWRSTDYDQCCDRIYRIGQTTDVHIFNVILKTEDYNLSDRMNKILEWSGNMFEAAINEADLEG